MQEIKDQLDELEVKLNIRILLACETGSRAWGFPSPDSDYDIRLIYMHSRNWYLSIQEKKDSLELMLNDNLHDISGWDLRKSLRLLWKSNPPLLERIQSPIMYKADPDFLKDIKELAHSCYSKIATMHHYLSMSKKIFEEVQMQESFKLKKLFYALRTAVACKWILEKDEMPPIEFRFMLDDLDMPSGIKSRILELIELKSHKNEDYLHTGEKSIFKFIQDCLVSADTFASSLPAAEKKMSSMDQFFIQTLHTYGSE